jgi:hypothetical protein
MAIESVIFPILPVSTWWKLRKKLNNSIPKEMSASYIATALDMTEVSAKVNVIPKLKLIGFIDDNNKPTEVAIQWRDDDHYPLICKDLINKLYPSELVDAIDDPINNKSRVVKWFQSKARVGEGAANRMAGFYLLLVEGDPMKQSDASTGKVVSNRTGKVKEEKVVEPKKESLKKTSASENNNSAAESTPNHTSHDVSSSFKPTIHLDIQIHISPDSSFEQIDKIFASMAKHLTGFKL